MYEFQMHHSKLMYRLLSFLTVLLSSLSLSLADTIIITGSDTLGAKLVPLLSEAYLAENEKAQNSTTFEISAEGSNTGIAAVIDGTTSIGLSSTRASQTELLKAQSQGVELAHIPVAQDAIAVIVNKNNPIENLSLRVVESIFTGDIKNWAALSNYSGRISAYSRNTSSGTYRAFQSLALRKRNFASKVLKMASNEQIVAEVEQNPYGIGYVGLAYINSPSIKVVSIDGFSPADGNAYSLNRPLYYLIDKNRPLPEATNQFIGFTLSPRGQKIVSSVNFIPIY